MSDATSKEIAHVKNAFVNLVTDNLDRSQGSIRFLVGKSMSRFLMTTPSVWSLANSTI